MHSYSAMAGAVREAAADVALPTDQRTKFLDELQASLPAAMRAAESAAALLERELTFSGATPAARRACAGRILKRQRREMVRAIAVERDIPLAAFGAVLGWIVTAVFPEYAMAVRAILFIVDLIAREWQENPEQAVLYANQGH